MRWRTRVLVALCAAASVGAGDAPKGSGAVPLRVRVLEIDGLQWRVDAWKGLELVDQKGTALIWSTDPKTLGRLFGTAGNETVVRTRTPSARGPQAPSTTSYVAWLTRSSGGPPGAVTSVVLKPTSGLVFESTEAEVSGWPDGMNNVLAMVSLRDTRVLNVHSVMVSQPCKTRSGNRTVNTVVSGAYQVPEVVTAEVKGQWTVPAGRALVIGLGAHTVAEPTTGQAVVRERLVVVDADDLDEAAFDTARAGAHQPSYWRPPGLYEVGQGIAWVVVVALGGGSVWLVGWSLRRGRPADLSAGEG